MNKTVLAAAVALVGSLSCQAQVTTDPVGFVSVAVAAKTDVAIGIPLGRANEFQGVIQSVSGTTGSVTVTVAGTPGWTTNQFLYVAGTQPKTYYARIDSGAREGLIGMITANDASTVTITVPTGDDLVNVSTNAVLVSPATTGDSISIAPCWTLGTLLSGVVTGVQALTYPTNTAGINLSASAVYYTDGTDWFFLQTGANSNDVVLPPGQGFSVRNNTTNPTTISITGSVPMATNRLVVRTLAASKQQDQRIFFNSPVPEYVGATGLGTTPGDQLIAFDNAAAGENKSAVAVMVWTGSIWQDLLQNFKDVTNIFQLQPGTSYILRKASSPSPATSISSHLQSYLQ